MLFHVFPQSGIRKFSHLFVSCFALVVVSALLLFFHPPKVYSAQMTLAWDPNTEPDLRGYKVYYGTSSGTYGVPLYVRNVTDYTLTGLTEGQVYYIAVTAYDKSGNESVYSNEVSGAAREPTQIYTILQDFRSPWMGQRIEGKRSLVGFQARRIPCLLNRPSLGLQVFVTPMHLGVMEEIKVTQ
jgi:hypothetical protein